MEEILQKIYQLALKKMKEQGGYDRAAFREYIDETIDYYRGKGKLTDDDSDEFISTQLMQMWDDAQDELSNTQK